MCGINKWENQLAGGRHDCGFYINSFFQSKIYAVPVQVDYYSEMLPSSAESELSDLAPSLLGSKSGFQTRVKELAH